MKQLNRINKTYTQKNEDAMKGAPYVASKGKGGYFEDFNLKEVLMQIIAEINLMRGWWEALGLLSQEELDKLNIRNSKSALNNMWQMIDKSKLLIDGMDNHALEFVGEYVSKFMKIAQDNIYTGDIPDDALKGYTKFEDGKLIVDETKKQEYLKTL